MAKLILVLFLFLFLTFLIGQDHLKCHGQVRNTEQLNIGVIFSVPYDISNTLRAPLGGPLSVVLTAGMAIVLFFGVVAGPLSYFLGTPPRKYYPHEPSKRFEQKPVPDIFNGDGDILKLTENAQDEDYYTEYDDEDYEFGEMKSKSSPADTHSPQKFKGNRTKSRNKSKKLKPRLVKVKSTIDSESRSFSGSNSAAYEVEKCPGFEESAFFFLPEENEACKELLVCHAHGFIPYLPENLVKLITFFTRKVGLVPQDLTQAIKIGLEDQGSCSQIYTDCHRDLQTIVQSTCSELFTSSLDMLNIKQADLENQFSSILSSVLLSLE